MRHYNELSLQRTATRLCSVKQSLEWQCKFKKITTSTKKRPIIIIIIIIIICTFIQRHICLQKATEALQRHYLVQIRCWFWRIITTIAPPDTTIHAACSSCQKINNRPLYSNTINGQCTNQRIGNTLIVTLAVDEWAVTFGTARRGLGGLRLCCTKCNSPSINGQCTNFILFDVAL